MRYTVLTYIINDYELVHEIENKDPDAEYVLVTDNPNLSSKTWTVVYDEKLKDGNVFNRCYKVRFNCFKYCNTDICVRIDGSISIKKSLAPLIDEFENGKYDLALMPHPINYNFIREYNDWVKQRRYPKKQAEHCINIMRSKGYDFDYKGMFQSCISIQRRGKITEEIDRLTMSLLMELGYDGNVERINQIPLSFVVNTYFSDAKLLPLSEQILYSPYMQWYTHRSNNPNGSYLTNLIDKDEKWLFNKKVNCWKFDIPLNQPDVYEYSSRLIDNFRTERSLQEKRIYRLAQKNKKHVRLMWCFVVLSSIMAIIISCMLLG